MRASVASRGGELSLVATFLLLGVLARVWNLSGVPPGLHFDEAANGLLAQSLRFRDLPVFIADYSGREPLLVYTIALFFRLFHPDLVILRLAPALHGIVALGAFWWLGRSLFGDRVGLFALAFGAVFYWHVSVSRNVYEMSGMVALQAPAVAGLWVAWTRRSYAWSVLAGIFLGASLYTYPSTRIFPAFVTLLVGVQLALSRGWRRQALTRIAVAGTTGLLVALPLLYHFYTHPQDFWERANQVLAVGTGELRGASPSLPVLLVRNVLDTARGYFTHGDPRWAYNLSGRPVLDPFAAILLLAGLGLVVRRWREARYAILPFWIALSWVPSIVTAEPMPSMNRMSGAIPPTVLLVALGAEVLWRSGWRPLAAALLVLSGAVNLRDYFLGWGGSLQAYYAVHGDYVTLAQAAAEERGAGREVVILSEHYKHPTVVFLDPESLRERWVFSGSALVGAGAGELATLVPSSLELDERIRSLLAEAGEPVRRWGDPSGGVAVRGYHSPLELWREARPPAVMGGEVSLEHVSYPPSSRRDEALPVEIGWRSLKRPGEGRSWALHLLDEAGVLWAQWDGMHYLSEQWRPGDRVLERMGLELPAGIPPGLYRLRLALVREGSSPLPVLSPSGELTGLWQDLGSLTLTREGAEVRQSEPILAQTGGLALTSVEGPIGVHAPGSALVVEAGWWRAGDEPSPSQVSLFAADASGSVRRWRYPLAAGYPPDQWRPGEWIRDRYRFVVPPEVRDGPLVLHLEMGEGFRYLVGTVEIRTGQRIFSAPDIPETRYARLGTSVELLGYALEPSQPSAGETVSLTLYWRAAASVPRSYKVFVHLVDPSGQVVSQSDAIPAQWSRPTTGWLPGEVLLDRHELRIPDGKQTYQLLMGMYEAEGALERLPAYTGGGERYAEDRIALVEIGGR